MSNVLMKQPEAHAPGQTKLEMILVDGSVAEIDAVLVSDEAELDSHAVYVRVGSELYALTAARFGASLPEDAADGDIWAMVRS